MFPGFPQTSHEWRKVTPLLVKKDLEVVALDYRGAGGSSKPAGGCWRCQAGWATERRRRRQYGAARDGSMTVRSANEVIGDGGRHGNAEDLF
ncbi:alpha/beta fold hydrolase [Rhizobium sp. YAF28]|uniref:alpha/beta fold hydrolase n=1 Tax=Rhizobium sp. YAF28 TaxID=3233081 RepID=UPI003F99F204